MCARSVDQNQTCGALRHRKSGAPGQPAAHAVADPIGFVDADRIQNQDRRGNIGVGAIVVGRTRPGQPMAIKIERNQSIFVAEQGDQRLPSLEQAVRSVNQENCRSVLIALLAVMDLAALAVIDETRCLVAIFGDHLGAIGVWRPD